jgi:hypothetical protein
MYLRLIVLALFAAVSVAATAGSLDVNLSRDSIEGRYNSSVGLGEMTLGALYNDDQKDWAANIGLLAMSEVNSAGSRLEGGLGGKIYAVSVGNAEVLALGLGGQFRWFPGNSSFGLGGYAFYAPGIVTLLDGRRFREVGVRAEVELFKNSSLYIGYREVRAELDDHTKRDVDKGSFIGIQIRF